MSRMIGSPTWEPEDFDYDHYYRGAERLPTPDPELEPEPCGYDNCPATENLCEWCGECPKHCQLDCIKAIEALHQGGIRE